MTWNTPNKYWTNALALLIATAVCTSIIAGGSLLIRRLRFGKSFDGRPMIQWVNDLNGPDHASSERARKVVQSAGPEAVPELIKLLSSPRNDSETRVQAADCLALIGRKSNPAVPALVAVLKERNEALQIAALNALTKTPVDPALAVPAYVKLLDNSSARIRSRAASNLSQLPSGIESAIPALKKACDDPDWVVRARAADALEKVGIEAPVRKSNSPIPPPPPPP